MAPQGIIRAFANPDNFITYEPETPTGVVFQPPSYFTGFKMPADAILVGDSHLARGDVTVLGGPPGCGKSRLLVSLAIAGRQGPEGAVRHQPEHRL